MLQFLDTITPLLRYWPVFAVIGILMIVGKISAVLFPPYTSGWRFFAHKTLSLQPVFLGGLIGFLFRPKMPGIDLLSEQILVCAGCGFVSVWCYQVLKGLAKKQGYDLDLPGLEGDNDDK